jgi:hypothetical protein
MVDWNIRNLKTQMENFQIAQTKATNMCETLKFVQEQHKEINRLTCIITKLKT